MHDRGRSPTGRERNDMSQTIVGTDAAECRRLADLLHLDAVGIVRPDGPRRRVAWWASPAVDTVPLERILEGRAADWIACPRGEDVVFAHLTDGSTVRSVSTLSAMLGSLTTGSRDNDELDGLGGVAPDDPMTRERTRLAYAIHDGLTQVVTASVLELEWQARRVDLEPVQAVEALTDASVELRKALAEIRSMLASLSPLADGSEQPIDELVQGVLERWQLPASWSVDGDLHAVPRPVLDVASSVIRESVANAAKHAGSSDVAVAIRATRAAVEVRVEDQGKGFRPANTGLQRGHLGLEMMQRRVAAVNGTLDIDSTPGKGTRVVARLPVSDKG
jgi:signal transduction histidine kinase